MTFLAFLFSNLVFFSAPSFAELTFTESVLGNSTSAYRLDESTLVIWGGLAGSDGGDCPQTETVCNSCKDDDLTACNTRRISGSQRFTIEFSFSEDITGKAFIRPSDETVNVAASTGSVSKGSLISTDLLFWSYICANLTSGDITDDCSGGTYGSGSFTIGVVSDSDSEVTDSTSITIYVFDAPAASAGCSPTDLGIRQYTAFPGDEKIFFPSESASVTSPLEFCTTQPTGTEANFEAILAFYSDVSLADVDLLSPSGRFNISGTVSEQNTSIDEAFIDDLVNEQRYFTRLAVQDQAGNIFGVIPADKDPLTPAICTGINSSSAIEDVFNCPYSSVPLSVAGLLEDDVNCFIATAAFGSSLHNKVKDFRAFRSQILLKSKAGVWLVRKYYKWGSLLSVYIANSSVLKKLSQIILYPLWLFAIISLKLGLLSTALLLIFSFIAMFVLLKKWLQYKRRSVV